MPKKDKARKKGTSASTRELTFKEAGHEYAVVNKMLGNGRLDATCQDGKNRLCHIRGNMRNRQWIGVGDLILISLREYEDDKADVVHKYSNDECRRLKKLGELTLEVKEKEDNNIEDDNVDFDSI